MTQLVHLASVMSETFHSNQKYGIESYFKYHIEGVVNSLKLHNFCDDYIIVGYLHDLAEDTSISLDTIYNLFGKTIGDAVKAITKVKDEPRINYLSRCASNPIARMVKLHDALFNATNCHKNKNKTKVNYYLDTINSLKVM